MGVQATSSASVNRVIQDQRKRAGAWEIVWSGEKYLTITSHHHPDHSAAHSRSRVKNCRKSPKIGSNRGKNATILSHSEPVLAPKDPIISRVLQGNNTVDPADCPNALSVL